MPPLEFPDKISRLQQLKRDGIRVACLTAYDYPTARLLDESGLDLLLVGDSLGMVVFGDPDTTGVTLTDMIRHTRAVSRGVTNALIVADLPIATYRTPGETLASARKLLEAGAESVKMEGGREIIPQINSLTRAKIPFLGHIGMLPQHIKEEGRYKKKGKTAGEAARLLEDALLLEKAGAWGIVLESIVPEIAQTLSQALTIPTIGVGSGPDCDGQILVNTDLFGSFPWFVPPFAQPEADVAGEIRRAALLYLKKVKGIALP